MDIYNTILIFFTIIKNVGNSFQNDLLREIPLSTISIFSNLIFELNTISKRILYEIQFQRWFRVKFDFPILEE